MSEGLVVLGLYAALLAVIVGDIAGPGRLRRRLLGVRATTLVTFALVAWIALTEHATAIEPREALVWIVLLIAGLVFIQMSGLRDRGLGGGTFRSREAAHGPR